jgi:hypothetical protein
LKRLGDGKAFKVFLNMPNMKKRVASFKSILLLNIDLQKIHTHYIKIKLELFIKVIKNSSEEAWVLDKQRV